MSAQDATDVDERPLTGTSSPTPPGVFGDGSATRHWALVDGEQGPVHIGSPGPFPPPEALCGRRYMGLHWSNSRPWNLPADQAPIGVCMECWEHLEKTPEKNTISRPRSTHR